MAKKKDLQPEIMGNLDPKYWVQKSDPLVLMRSVPFSLGELKILDTYISRINANDPSRDTVKFTKSEYEKLMGLSEVNVKSLKKHTEGLLGKIVTLQMPNKDYMQFVLFTVAYYHKDDYGVPVIELSCSPQARDLFFCIGKYHYFKYALENVINLTRRASYLLYIYLLPNRYRKEWTITLDELRDNILDCKGQSSYKLYKEFKRAVLAPAVKEINTKTDCHFEYTALKRGRRVTEIKFTIEPLTGLMPKPDTTYPEQLSLEEDTVQDDNSHFEFLRSACDNEFSLREIKVIFNMINTMDLPDNPMGVWFARYHYLAEKYSMLNLASDRTSIRDRFSYFKAIIDNDRQE